MGGRIGGEGWKERCCGCKTSAKGQHANEYIGTEGIKRLGTGGRVSGEWLHQGESLALPDRMSLGGGTQNWSLRYKRLECLAHKVSGERQNARYFFCRCYKLVYSSQ